MKLEKKYWCSRLLLLLFLACPAALPQAVTVAGNGSNDSANISLKLASASEQGTGAPLQLASDGQSPSSSAQTSPAQTAGTPAETPYGWHVAIYPVLAWAPVFGASVTLPSLPGQPGPSGSASGSLNGAYFGGARFEKGKWSADAMFMWAALSAQRQNPLVNVHLDFVFGDAMVGREVLPNLYLEGGVRRVALDVRATVVSSSASRSPGFWDPLIGLTYRRELGKKWRILIHGDGGGFGVGSDVDVTATGRAEWQFARHFGVTAGYGGMHFSESSTVNGGTLKISPTLHGPIFGLGIFF